MVGALSLGVVGYVATMPLDGSANMAPAPSTAFQQLGQPVAGIAIGQAAPDFITAQGDRPVLFGLDGAPVRLVDFASRPVWIVFWATWCTPCQQEAPEIRAAYQRHAASGLAVLAIDVLEPMVAVQRYATEHELDYAIAVDTAGDVRQLYGAWGLPAHYFLDGHGIVRDRYFGQMTPRLMELRVRSIVGS